MNKKLPYLYSLFLLLLCSACANENPIHEWGEAAYYFHVNTSDGQYEIESHKEFNVLEAEFDSIRHSISIHIEDQITDTRFYYVLSGFSTLSEVKERSYDLVSACESNWGVWLPSVEPLLTTTNDLASGIEQSFHITQVTPVSEEMVIIEGYVDGVVFDSVENTWISEARFRLLVSNMPNELYSGEYVSANVNGVPTFFRTNVKILREPWPRQIGYSALQRFEEGFTIIFNQINKSRRGRFTPFLMKSLPFCILPRMNALAVITRLILH